VWKLLCHVQLGMLWDLSQLTAQQQRQSMGTLQQFHLSGVCFHTSGLLADHHHHPCPLL
jgi:hypothetical protein